MTIKIDTTKLQNSERHPAPSVFPTPECQFGEPKIAVAGVSFPNVPTFIGVRTKDIITSETITVVSECADVTKPLDLRINLVSPTKELSAAERYVQLRKEIVGSGLPLLDDEELRQEIRERKGVKAEPES